MSQGATASAASLRAVSIPVRAPSNEDYQLLIVPRWALPFFVEGYKVRVALVTSQVVTEVWLTSARNADGARVGDPVGQYLWGLQRVVQAHAEWRCGKWANFERRGTYLYLTITDRPTFYHQTTSPPRGRRRSPRST